ncbi:ATP synthase subunit I [Gimesia benthica]|uniref:ATP synthase subunit I n=1 Tax=Gimesia benthica TaxID=2608982 RepID=A0A6I6AHZ2_9PLAN|nr:ATP synthase subunit I [Gimesia benthica]QGQ26037.1 ATP synthase subunit I [Gimesia benthica]
MNLPLSMQLLVSLLAGLLLGAIFFGGLWLTVKQLPKVSAPWLLFLGSALGRTLIILAGFWCVGIWLSESFRWQRTAVCLAGFIIARMMITRYTRSTNVPATGKSA